MEEKTLRTLEVGDAVCVRILGAHEPHEPYMEWCELLDLLVDATVWKIGCKYASVKVGTQEYQFDLDTGCEIDFGYPADYVLFPSRHAAEERMKKEYLLWKFMKKIDSLANGLHTSENCAWKNFALSRWEQIAALLNVDIPWAAENASGRTYHKKGDICMYSFDKEENKSLAVVEIVDILNDSRGVAEIKFLEVIVDDTGNKLFEYLLKSGKTMNASFQYLKVIRPN